MSEFLTDQEQNLGRGGHWTKGASVIRGGHQIDKFILKMIKKKERNKGARSVLGEGCPLQPHWFVPSLNCF